MRNLTVQRRYLWRLYPTADQTNSLHEQRMMCAELWNAMLQRYEDIRRRTRGQRGVHHTNDAADWTIPAVDNLLSVEIKDLRAECPEWQALSVWTPHETRRTIRLAFEAFVRRAVSGAGAQSGYPRYRRRSMGERIPHRHVLPPGVKSGSGSGCRLVIRRDRNWVLTIRGVDGSIHARGMLPAPVLKMSAADVLWRDGKWWFSVCCEMGPRREKSAHGTATHIEINGIDCLATVSRSYPGEPGTTTISEPETPEDLIVIRDLLDYCDRLKSERDKRWPRRSPQDPEWRDAQGEISRLEARIARRRRNALHVWSARLVRDASSVSVRSPQVSDHVVSPHGDKQNWGAATEIVSQINRHILNQAPATLCQMLKYKAEEAGIEFVSVTPGSQGQKREVLLSDEAPAIAIGAGLVKSGRTLRRTTRRLKKKERKNG